MRIDALCRTNSALDLSSLQTYTLQDEVLPLYPVVARVRSCTTPIVLDNGSWRARLGWATESSPRLVYRNLAAGSKNSVKMGNEIRYLEPVRETLRSPFERNLVTQLEVFEKLLDYGASHLGSDLKSGNLVLTEAPLNPNYCRANMSELVFEKFGSKSLLCGIDALFAGYHRFGTMKDVLHLVLGHRTCHVLPVLDGKLRPEGARRLNVGGCDLAGYLQKLLHLKDSSCVNQVTYERAEEIFHKFCRVADGPYSRAALASVEPVRVVFANNSAATPAILSQQELEMKRTAALERRNAHVARLKEMHRKRLEKKLQELEDELRTVQSANADSSLKEESQDVEDPEEEEVNKVRRADLAEQQEEECQERTEKLELLSLEITKVREKLANLDEAFGNADYKKDEEWLASMRLRREKLVEKREEIKKFNSEMSQRGSKSSRERLRMLWQLADEGNAKKRARRDDFGSKDEDWEVYRVVSRQNWESLHDVEMELHDVERLLAQHEVDDRVLRVASNQAAPPNETVIQTERIRVPEVLFQPAALLGLSQGGILDGLESSLGVFDAEESQRLVDNVVVSGGLAHLPGLKERMEYEIRCIRPVDSSFKINFIQDLNHDAWRGAASFAKKLTNEKLFVKKSEYEEFGAAFFREHSCSNRFYED